VNHFTTQIFVPCSRSSFASRLVLSSCMQLLCVRLLLTGRSSSLFIVAPSDLVSLALFTSCSPLRSGSRVGFVLSISFPSWLRTWSRLRSRLVLQQFIFCARVFVSRGGVRFSPVCCSGHNYSSPFFCSRQLRHSCTFVFCCSASCSRSA
jgi:hypothetical protein